MSAAAPPRVLDLAERSRGPVLIYDVPAIVARLVEVRTAAHAARVQVLAAVKALGVPELVARAATYLDGVDVAGPHEDAAAKPAATVSVTFPGGAGEERLRALCRGGRRVIVSCETAAQVAAAALVSGCEIAVRLSVSELGEVAPGGLRDRDGAHRSRFGVAVDELRALAAVAPGRVRALHLHGGAVATHRDVLVARARAALAAADDAGLQLSRLDLGGSLHGFALDHAIAGQTRLADALAAVRAAVPSQLELCVEPGRVLTEACGYASGAVLAARSIGGLDARVLELSRLCHLRWSTPRLCAPPPTSGDRRAVVLVGATCCEDDVICDAQVPGTVALREGARVVVAGVSGYAAAWNRGFAGVAAAAVHAVD